MTIPMETLISKYVASLSVHEVQSMETAKRLLNMTFDIKKSNGFLQWLKEQNL